MSTVQAQISNSRAAPTLKGSQTNALRSLRQGNLFRDQITAYALGLTSRNGTIVLWRSVISDVGAAAYRGWTGLDSKPHLSMRLLRGGPSLTVLLHTRGRDACNCVVRDLAQCGCQAVIEETKVSSGHNLSRSSSRMISSPRRSRRRTRTWKGKSRRRLNI